MQGIKKLDAIKAMEQLFEDMEEVTEDDIIVFQDYLEVFKRWTHDDHEGRLNQTYGRLLKFRATLNEALKCLPDSRLYEVLKKTYLVGAPFYFEDYMIYIEWEREPQDRFYIPRQKQLKAVVKGIQDLVDGDLNELFISLPPRVGKTSLLMFLMTWLMGRNSEQSNLYCAFSDTITRAFYSGVLEVINDPTTYLWGDVFPDAKIVSTNAQEETIDIGRKKRYHSLTARSLYGTLNGACDCNGFLISDDLIGGIEEALNKDRLASAWAKVDNNLIPRAKESAKFIWCGTRWSVADPTGNRLDSLKNDLRFKNRKYRVINVPALAKSGRSNFNYKYGVGFSTEYYQQRKASFEHMGDLASWEAQYMGQPVERSGRLFEAMELNMYNGDLPDEELLVRKFMAVDPAFGGGDYTSAPIAYQYQDGSIYIVDVVYSNANKRITQPMIAKKIVEHELKAVQFEANKMTASFKEKVEELVHEMGYRCNMTTKAASTHMAKELRIFDKAPEIRDFYYLEGQKRSSEYQQFMDNVFAFSINGKNRHDDAPDSLAMLVDMMYAAQSNVKVKSRFF